MKREKKCFMLAKPIGRETVNGGEANGQGQASGGQGLAFKVGPEGPWEEWGRGGAWLGVRALLTTPPTAPFHLLYILGFHFNRGFFCS